MSGNSNNNIRFKVGYVEGILFDPKRSAWSGFGPRPIRTAVWYPAAPNSIEKLATAGSSENPWFILGKQAEKATLASDHTHYPVVLISHGTGGSAQGMSWLAIRLARQGYIALAVSHHGNTAAEPYCAEGFACWWERAHDLTVALDQLCHENIFSGRVDLSKVYAAGFSLGAYTVLALAGAITDMQQFTHWNKQFAGGRGPREFPDLDDKIEQLMAESAVFRQSMSQHGQSYHDPRLSAVVLYAPAPPVRAFITQSLAQIKLPVCIMVGQADKEAPYKKCACWLDLNLPNSQLILLGDEVGHYVFLCEATEHGKALAPDICCDPDGVDRHKIHNQAASAAVALFRSAET